MSVALLDPYTPASLGAIYTEMRKLVRRQLNRSIRNDCKQRWIGECKKVEKTAAIDSSHNLCQLIRSTVSGKLDVDKSVMGLDGSLIRSEELRLEFWTWHFSE